VGGVKLPFLDQTIELARGEANDLCHVVSQACLSIVATLEAERPVPMPAGLLLALPALRRLMQRFGRVAQQELSHVGRPKRKPHTFRLSYDELVALMLYVQPYAATAHVPLGKVQQKSLNLELFIDFTQVI
jgi:hypothetical protein